MPQSSLKELLTAAHEHRLVLPQFQRDFVWQPAMVLKLLNSIFNGYPIGSLLLMENNDNYQYRRVEGAPSGADADPHDIRLILDGQQRVTASYRAFFGGDETVSNAGRYYFNYGEFVRLLESGTEIEPSELEALFTFKRRVEIAKGMGTAAKEIDQQFLPLDCVLHSARGVSYVEWLDQHTFLHATGDRAKFDKLSKIKGIFQQHYIERVTSYQVSYELIRRDTNPDVICTIFETINTTGVKLTVFDLLVAKCFKIDLKLRDELEAFLSTDDYALRFQSEVDAVEQIAVTQLPKIISLLNSSECRRGDILGLKNEQVKNHWKLALVGFSKALSFLHQNCGVVALWLLPSADIVAPLAAALAQFDKSVLNAKRNEILQWYWACVFGRYFSGAPDTKVAKTFRELRDMMSGVVSIQNVDAVKSIRLQASDVREATKQTSLYKGILSLIVALGAEDIGIERRKLCDLRVGDIEDHHIFPQKFLANYRIKGSHSNAILNRMPMWKGTNNVISSVGPEKYFLDLSVVGKLDQSTLDPYGIDLDQVTQQFSQIMFEDFKINRLARLIDIVSQALKKSEQEFFTDDG